MPRTRPRRFWSATARWGLTVAAVGCLAAFVCSCKWMVMLMGSRVSAASNGVYSIFQTQAILMGGSVAFSRTEVVMTASYPSEPIPTTWTWVGGDIGWTKPHWRGYVKTSPAAPPFGPRLAATIPLWIPFLTTAMPAAFLWTRHIRRRRIPNTCPCGYSRAGLTAGAACPECGAAGTVAAATGA